MQNKALMPLLHTKQPLQHRIATTPGRMLALRAPPKSAHTPFILSKLSLPDLVAQLQAESATLAGLGRWLMGAGTASLAAAVLIRLAAWDRRRKMRRRIEEARRARLAAGAAANEEASSPRARLTASPCAVCLERDCEMVFTACGHLCVCERCGAELRSCPLCRARGTAVRVYVA